MIQTRREILRKVLRKLSSPNDLRRYLEFKLISGDEYPWFDFTDAFPRTASLAGSLCRSTLDIDRPVFIISLRRSGSTLFYRLMNAHSKLFLFNERFPGDRKGGRGQPSTRNIYYTIDKPVEFRQTALRYLSPKLRRNFERWGCKLSLELAHPDPGSVAYPTMEKIAKAFPDARIIGLTRDPRDFTLSALKRGGHDVDWWIREYCSMMSLFRSLGKNHPDRFFHIRYEDLVMNTEESLTRCCDFSDLEFQPAMLDPASWSVKGPREYVNSGIKAKIDKWRNADGVELEFVDRVSKTCFPGAEQLGYSVK